MPLLGMGVNMQYNGYFPRYYFPMDLNMDANSSKWPLNNIDKMLESGHHYNGFLSPVSPDQVLEKEVLKQTMLKHEAIFKVQIHELHRLYRRQRELMDEVKRNGLYKLDLRFEVSLSNSILSRTSSEYAQKTCHTPSSPWVYPACSRPSVSGAENVQLPLSSIQGKSMQVCPHPAQTEGCSKDSELLESKCKKIGKKILDLQLPAYEYIDSEEGESFEAEKVLDVANYPSKGITQVVSNSIEKPFLGCNGFNSVFHEEASTPASLLKKPTGLADLNEPIKFEEEADHKSDFIGPNSPREISCFDLSRKTTSGFQLSSKEIIPNNKTKWDLEACSDVLMSEKKERKQEWLSFNNETGFDAGKLSKSSESLCKELKQAFEPPTFHLLNQSNQISRITRTISGLDSSGRNHGASYVCTSHELVPQAEVVISGSSLVASCRKPVRDVVRNPIAVQALPCFNTSESLGSSKSSIGRPGLAGDKFHCNKNLGSSPKRDSACFLESSFCNQSESRTSKAHPSSVSFDDLNSNNNCDLASEFHGNTVYTNGSVDVRSSDDINLNFMPDCCSSYVEVSQSIQNTDGKKKLGESTRASPWLRAKGEHDGRPDKGGEDLTQTGSAFLQTYAECIPDVESKKVEASDSSSGRRILGFPFHDKPHISSDQCSSHASPSETHQNPSEDEVIENFEKDGVIDKNLTCNPVLDSGKQLTKNEHVVENGLDKIYAGFGGHIDLNSLIDEDESSPVPSLSTEVNLEAPASPENKECSPPRGESNENQLETTLQSSGPEDADLQEELVRVAAEAIVSISSSVVQIFPERTTCKPFEVSSTDSLHWFAKIVSSVVVDPENDFGVVMNGKNGEHHDEFLPDGIDFFEAMTLKLTETKQVDCCCKSNVQKDEERGVVSPPSRSRKGRTRGRRQRKDFQSEILPSLASLSRHEVTEDLQIIGGLMEAAGNRWARGRRRSGMSASSVAENTVGSLTLLKQLTGNSELGVKERSLIGWGKITRRRRGQRCPVSNPRLILGQV